MRLIYLFIFLFSSIVVEAQTPKKVYDVLGLDSGCPLPMPTKGKEELVKGEEVEFDEVVAPPPPPPYPAVKKTLPPPPPSNEMFNKYLQNLKTFIQKNPTEIVLEFGVYEFFQNENYLWGLRTKSGEILIKPIYEHIKTAREKPHFVAQIKGSKGLNLFEISGKKLLTKDYDYVSQNPNLDYVRIGVKEKRGIVNYEDNIIIEPEYQQISKAGDYWIVKNNDLFGLLDKQGKPVITPKYKKLKRILSNNNDEYFAIQENKELRIYKGGKILYELGIKFYEYAESQIFDERYLFYNKQLIDLKNNLFLFCNEKVEINKTRIADNLFYIKDKEGSWFFNEAGTLVADQPFGGRGDKIRFGMEDVSIASIKSEEINDRGYSIFKYGLINKKMEWIVDPSYYFMQKMKDTTLFIAVNDKSMFGMVDAKGKVTIPFVHEAILPVVDRIFVTDDAESKQFKVLDIDGNFLFETTLNHKNISKNSVAYEGRRLSDRKRVILNEKFEEIYVDGFSNCGMFGKEAFWIERFENPKYYEIVDMTGTTYPIMIDGKPRTDLKNLDRVHPTSFFFLQFSNGENFLYNTNTKNAHPINPEIGSIDDGTYTSNGVFFTGKSYRKSMGLIDSLGNEILPPAFEAISKIYENVGIFSVSTKNKKHIFTFDGKELFEEYENSNYLFNQFFAVKKDGKVGVLRINGEVVIPFEYKTIIKKHPERFQATTFQDEKIHFGINGDRY